MIRDEAHFQRIQREFAACIRAPEAGPPPAGVSGPRMATYRDLFFNNIENFIATGFPVLKSLLGEDAWRSLVRDFYARHRCATPLFIGIAGEFLDYLRNEREDTAADPPFLAELAHYEWVELALAVHEGEPPPLRPLDRVDPAVVRAVLSPVAWKLGYRYPVHRIGPAFQPGAAPAEPTWLVAYRDREDGVRFLEVNAVTHRLLEWIENQSDLPLHRHLHRLSAELGHPDPASVLEYGLGLAGDLHQKGVLDLIG